MSQKKRRGSKATRRGRPTMETGDPTVLMDGLETLMEVVRLIVHIQRQLGVPAESIRARAIEAMRQAFSEESRTECFRFFPGEDPRGEPELYASPEGLVRFALHRDGYRRRDELARERAVAVVQRAVEAALVETPRCKISMRML
jgi:hypothetical protein